MPSITASDFNTATPADTAPRPHLFVVLDCEAPLDAPSRHALDDVDEVRVGRGPVRRAVRRSENGHRYLTLTLADARVSSAHAKLVRRGSEWALEDLGSKNGSFVDGARVETAPLSDGDCLQIGHTLLVLRTALPTARGSPSDLEARARAPAFATLLPRFARELDVLTTAAASDVPILLSSETGTGKEVLARAIHELSRRSGAFVPVNCGGLPATLVDSTLFGHKRGAFSGATADHAGLFRTADKGTLLLDEIGDMPAAVQATVLRALQSGEVLPVGATQPLRVDVRVLAATHRDLEAMVGEGTFREDLLARLSGFTFRLPPLRDRREDIGLLAGVLLRRLAAEGQPVPAFSAEAGRALLRHSWPRNVRELEKCLAVAMALASGGRIEPRHLPPTVTAGVVRRPRSDADQLRDRLVALLTKSGGNVSSAASALHTSRSQVHRWMKRFQIEPSSFRRGNGL